MISFWAHFLPPTTISSRSCWWVLWSSSSGGLACRGTLEKNTILAMCCRMSWWIRSGIFLRTWQCKCCPTWVLLLNCECWLNLGGCFQVHSEWRTTATYLLELWCDVSYRGTHQEFCVWIFSLRWNVMQKILRIDWPPSMACCSMTVISPKDPQYILKRTISRPIQHLHFNAWPTTRFHSSLNSHVTAGKVTFTPSCQQIVWNSDDGDEGRKDIHRHGWHKQVDEVQGYVGALITRILKHFFLGEVVIHVTHETKSWGFWKVEFYICASTKRVGFFKKVMKSFDKSVLGLICFGQL